MKRRAFLYGLIAAAIAPTSIARETANPIDPADARSYFADLNTGAHPDFTAFATYRRNSHGEIWTLEPAWTEESERAFIAELSLI